MTMITSFGKKALALILALMLCTGYIGSAVGQSYAIAHPASVNQGKTDAQIESDDLEQFSSREGFDYHEADEDDYAPHELILEITSSKDNASASLNSFEDEFDLTLERVLNTTELEEDASTSAASIGGGNGVITTYFMSTAEDDIISLCDALNEREEIFNAQPNFKYEICDEPENGEVDMSAPAENAENPAAYTEPPAFSTTGYTNNLQWWFDYCQISSAWSTYADSDTGYGMGKGVTVAVIDTGCNTAHEDIKANLWKGSNNECGYFAYQSQNIYENDAQNDTNGHGSHCCGTIAMDGNNSVGGIGVAPYCKLMVLKADRNNGKGNFYSSELITSLNKAKENGADIVSMSLGGYSFDYSTYRTYQNVSSSCLIVCAAGNESFDTTEKLHFPSAASCVMGVMALSSRSNINKLAYFSNYDTTGTFYRVAAPGTDIYSLKGVVVDSNGNPTSYPTNQYTNMNGTSMATPATAGMIASFMSYIKYVKGWNWTPAQYQYEVEYLMNYSGNTLSCSALSQSDHPVAYENGSTFKVMNLKYLFSRMASLSSNLFANTTTVSFSNSTILDGVKNSTGLTASELDTYAMRRVSLMYWSSDSTRKNISDYSDLSKLTGLSYLDLSGTSKVTANNIADIISKCPATLVHLNLNTTTKLTDLSCLANAKFNCLHYLNISSNDLTTLSPIAKFTSLRYLYANSNQLMDISALYGMTHIERIELNNNRIEDPNPAFASDFLNYIDLSHNKLSDHTQLLNYRGAYHDSDFHSDTINFFVDYNNMTGLTTSVANNIKAAIKNNNTKGGTEYATTINFTYTNQTAPSSNVPMTSFSIADMTVSREALCSGNLNLNSITGFRAYPSNANQYNYLNWTCSEDGYFASDGTVLCTAEQITSCRTLTLTGTAPAASGATSTVSGGSSQTIKLTITAPEIFNAYVADRVVATGRRTGVVATVNQYTSRIYIKITKSGGSDTVVYADVTDYETHASGTTKGGFFYLPESVTSTAGTYTVYAYPADSQNNYATTSNGDVSGKSTYPYKYAGTVYVKDSVETSTDTLNITYDTKVNRYGQSAVFASNSGTTSASLAKPEGDVNISTYTSQKKYIGSGGIFAAFGAGYFGKENEGYPSATTGEASFFYRLAGFEIESKITTVAPEVKAVEIRNPNTYKTDGYVEYLVKTNTDATTLKAYSVGTTDDICSDLNLVTTTFNSTSGTYGNYNSTYSHKLWSIKVPITSSKTMKPVTLTAADPLGDGEVTMTPATGLSFSGTHYYYPGENTYKVMSNYLTFQPVDSEGNTLANCCKSVTYSINNTDYFSITSQSTGRIAIDAEKFLTDFESTTTSYNTCTVTATLESGAKAAATIYASRPVAKSLNYDANRSVLAAGGTVYYSVKTYGSDTIYVRDTSDKYSAPFLTLTLADTESYVRDVDENGNEFITWNFERTFEPGVATLKTYVRSSYAFSDALTANSASYTVKTITRNLDTGDYSGWNAQAARITPALLNKLYTDYNVPNDTFTERYNAYTAVTDSAVLDYTETEQDLIDAQTLALKNATDALVGLGDYENALEQYETLMSTPNGAYCTPALEQLISTTATDNNYKELSEAILEEIDVVNELAQNYVRVINYLADLEAAVPELLTDEAAPLAYSAATYAPLKALYDTVKSKVDNTEYALVFEIQQDYNNLKTLKNRLHVHNYNVNVVDPTCTESGYTEHVCTTCGESYRTDELPALGHTPVGMATVNPTCTAVGYTGGTECSTCHLVLEEPEEVPALGHNWGVWTVITPATHSQKGLESRICLRDTSHKESREIPRLSGLPHTKLGDATDYTVDVSVADDTAGAYAGLVDIQLKISIDYTQLDTDDEKALTMFNQIIAFDPSVLSTVSKKPATRGTPNMQAMLDAINSSTYKTVSAGADFALNPLSIPTYEGAPAMDCITYSVADSSCLAYNNTTGEVFVLFNGIHTSGYINYDEIDRPEFSVLHFYLALQDGCTLIDARNAIRLVTDDDLQATQMPAVMENASFVSSKAESYGAIHDLDILFSDEYYPKYDITFKWYTDNAEEQSTVVPTTEGKIPADFTPENYYVGDTLYTFSGWDKELVPASGETTYTAQYSSQDLGHDFAETYYRNPTCTEAGKITYKCNRCGYTYTETPAALGHTLVYQPAVEPTCTETGLTEGYTCSVCNAKVVTQIQIPALGHSWVEWEIITEPTCTKDGELVRYCSRDASHKLYEPITAPGHQFAETVTAPTCTEQGYTTYACTVCDYSYTDNYTEPLGHSPQSIPAVAASCTKGGLSEGSKCSVCKAILIPQVIIPALGHDYGDWSVTTSPTCTQKGVETRVCSRDDSHKETRDIEALGHTPQTLKAVAPTCTETGLSEGSQCSVCKEILSAQQVVDALGHDYGDWSVTTPATCTQKGVETRVCSRDDSHKETRDLAMLPHTYTLHDAAPLDKHNGYAYYTCNVCAHTFLANYDGNKLIPGREVDSPQQAQANSLLPAPYFNIFISSNAYDYATRGASLRISESDAYDKDFETTQGMRFTASVKVPEGVDYKVGSEGSVITDFGFVYSQDELIFSDISRLKLGANDVYSMSVVSKNTGTYDGSNWEGVTYHEEDNTLTFNLVINVKAMNWEKDYCARAYITYTYNGYTFTVYDEEYATRSVADIATAVVNSPTETQEAKSFCERKILDNI